MTDHLTWTDEGYESTATLDGLTLTLLPDPDREGCFAFRVEKRGKVLARYGSCRDVREASICCALYALGWLHRKE